MAMLLNGYMVVRLLNNIAIQQCNHFYFLLN